MRQGPDTMLVGDLKLEGINRVLVFSNFSQEEIAKPRFGGSRLIALQEAFFRERGLSVHLVDLERLPSPTGLFLRSTGRIRRRRKKDAEFMPVRNERGERIIWQLNMLFLLVFEILSRLDFLGRSYIKHMVGDNDKVMAIWNYPFGVRILSRLRDNSRENRIQITIYAHNVEGEFYRERIGQGRLIRFFLSLFCQLELSNLSWADRVLCASARDREALTAYGLDSSRLVVFIPIISTTARAHRPREIPARFREQLNGRYVVGFVGSDYGPNIVAVRHIMEMAKKLAPNITFLIIGSVCNWFREEEAPDNVVLCGFVDSLEDYLAICDAFISPKTTSDTGLEVKVLDYLREGKPIFATSIGARGFENHPGIIIVELDEMPQLILKQAGLKPQPT